MNEPDEISASPVPQVKACRDRETWRLMGRIVITYLLNIYRLRRPFYRNDYDMAMISDAVAIHAATHIFADPEYRDVFSGLPGDLTRSQAAGCTALWVAELTGLPRETVRRKLKALVDHELLEQGEGGQYFLRAGILMAEPYRSGIAALEAETVRFINQCLADRIVELTPAGDQVARPYDLPEAAQPA